IRVQAEGAAYPMTQDQVQAQVRQAIQADLQRGPSLTSAAQVRRQPGAGGATTYEIAGGLGDERVSVMRFVPGDLTVRAGDTVRWVAPDPQTPHTVTFMDTAHQHEMDVIQPRPQPQGPPLLL